MKNTIMKSWKSTLAGCVGAAVNLVLPLIQTGTVDTKTIIISVILAVLGFLAKDFDVSGGRGQ